MTFIYDQKEHIYHNNPYWNNRIVEAHSLVSYAGRESKSQEFTIEKNQYGVEIKFQTHDDDYSRCFTHTEFEKFIEQCQWIAACNVEQKIP